MSMFSLLTKLAYTDSALLTTSLFTSVTFSLLTWTSIPSLFSTRSFDAVFGPRTSSTSESCAPISLTNLVDLLPVIVTTSGSLNSPFVGLTTVSVVKPFHLLPSTCSSNGAFHLVTNPGTLLLTKTGCVSCCHSDSLFLTLCFLRFGNPNDTLAASTPFSVIVAPTLAPILSPFMFMEILQR